MKRFMTKYFAMTVYSGLIVFLGVRAIMGYGSETDMKFRLVTIAMLSLLIFMEYRRTRHL